MQNEKSTCKFVMQLRMERMTVRFYKNKHICKYTHTLQSFSCATEKAVLFYIVVKLMQKKAKAFHNMYCLGGREVLCLSICLYYVQISMVQKEVSMQTSSNIGIIHFNIWFHTEIINNAILRIYKSCAQDIYDRTQCKS